MAEPGAVEVDMLVQQEQDFPVEFFDGRVARQLIKQQATDTLRERGVALPPRSGCGWHRESRVVSGGRLRDACPPVIAVERGSGFGGLVKLKHAGDLTN